MNCLNALLAEGHLGYQKEQQREGSNNRGCETGELAWCLGCEIGQFGDFGLHVGTPLLELGFPHQVDSEKSTSKHPKKLARKDMNMEIKHDI